MLTCQCTSRPNNIYLFSPAHTIVLFFSYMFHKVLWPKLGLLRADSYQLASQINTKYFLQTQLMSSCACELQATTLSFSFSLVASYWFCFLLWLVLIINLSKKNIHGKFWDIYIAIWFKLGRFLAELTMQVFSDLNASKYQVKLSVGLFIFPVSYADATLFEMFELSLL